MTDVDPAVQRILSLRKTVPAERSVLVGISGIDGSGKGFCTVRVDARLKAEGVRSAAINVDGWLNPPSKRFSPVAPAEHFYQEGIRFAELFAQLILPLKERRSLRLTADLTDPTNAEGFQPHLYEFHDLDVILLEGVFLFKREHRDPLDLAVWIDCSFETALERALARGQEGLPPEEAVHDYETIYFPAQRLHFERDDPKAFAHLMLVNDPRLNSRFDSASSSLRPPGWTVDPTPNSPIMRGTIVESQPGMRFLVRLDDGGEIVALLPKRSLLRARCRFGSLFSLVGWTAEVLVPSAPGTPRIAELIPPARPSSDLEL